MSPDTRLAILLDTKHYLLRANFDLLSINDDRPCAHTAQKATHASLYKVLSPRHLFQLGDARTFADGHKRCKVRVVVECQAEPGLVGQYPRGGLGIRVCRHVDDRGALSISHPCAASLQRAAHLEVLERKGREILLVSVMDQ